MLIGDNLTYHRWLDFPDPRVATPEALRDSFVPTKETGQVCSSILQRLAGFPAPQSKALLFTGRSGVGKTHVLRHLANLLENPSDPAWNALIPYLSENARPERCLHTLLVTVPADPDVDLARFLATAVAGDPQAASGTEALAPEEFAALVLAASSARSAGGVALLILEDVSRRMDQIASGEALLREKRIYCILIEALIRSGILPVLVGEERLLKRDREPGQGAAPPADFAQLCDFIWISRSNIIEVLSSALVTKDEHQKDTVQGILDQLHKRFPAFTPDKRDFVALYPIHPNVFTALFQLRSILREFSPLSFMQDAIPRALERPAAQLITLDQLFDFVLPDLKQLKKFHPLLTSYQIFLTDVLTRFKAGIRLKVEALLKAITCSTICEDRPVDIRTLANSLLLCEDSEFLSSYSLTSALLMEMEQKGGMHLVAEGKKLERSYRLLDLTEPVSFPVTRERFESTEELRRQFPMLLYDWMRSEIPAWKPDFSSKYEISSQSLVAPLPEGERRPPGLVYFKSENDPFWTPEDFQVLEASQYPWILLVLSPLERSYESDTMLREFAARSERMLIWRPDRMSNMEAEQLHKLVTHAHAEGDSRALPASMEAREQAQQILQSLYVRRGQFLTSKDQWPIAEEIEDRTLSLYVSLHLSAVACLVPEPATERLPVAQPNPAAACEDKYKALRIAAVLAGLEQYEGLDANSIRDRVLEWWDEILAEQFYGPWPKVQPLPDTLMTTHFWREVKQARNHLEMVRPALECLRRGETTIEDAMEEVSHSFSGDEARLSEWAELLRNLKELICWLPGFVQTKDYINEAFPLGQKHLDQQRVSLLDSISRVHRFIRPSEREQYDRQFREFKRGYIDYYQSMHEEALNIVSTSEEAERKVDSRALQNLELLSNLLYTDKSYLNRVRILGKWILHNQCLLPVRQILERYPRCYCNFNPAGNRELTESAAQINGLIQEGIEYFRGALRNCSLVIIEDLKTLKVDEVHSKQIAALLSRGPLEPLRAKTVSILNKIIAKHSSDFLIALRS